MESWKWTLCRNGSGNRHSDHTHLHQPRCQCRHHAFSNSLQPPFIQSAYPFPPVGWVRTLQWGSGFRGQSSGIFRHKRGILTMRQIPSWDLSHPTTSPHPSLLSLRDKRLPVAETMVANPPPPNVAGYSGLGKIYKHGLYSCCAQDQRCFTRGKYGWMLSTKGQGHQWWEPIN